jgi:uncharacterized protein YuzE
MNTANPQEESLRIGYDQEADVLYLSLGEPRKGMKYQEAGEGIILRTDPETDRIVGVTVVDFAKNFSDVAQMAQVPITGEFVPA